MLLEYLYVLVHNGVQLKRGGALLPLSLISILYFSMHMKQFILCTMNLKNKTNLQAKDWVDDYTDLRDVHCSYRPQYVTPYMHILTYHVPHLIRMYGNIKQFSCQGKEYLMIITEYVNLNS